MRACFHTFPALSDLLLPALLSVCFRPTLALTQEEIDELDGNIILGNRADGGRIQIFPSDETSWRKPLWEYDTKKGRDGLTQTFDWINDVKRIRYMKTELILLAGNGPGLALFNLHTEQFVFSYKPEMPTGSRCSLKALSIHSAEMLPDGNFAVADPTGSNRGGNTVRLIYGSNANPQILQSLPFSGVHAVVWDYKRQRLWAFGASKLKKYSYVSAGLDSALTQDGPQYKTPSWISTGHDMMPMYDDGQPDRLIFTCAEGVGVFHIEDERFELLYGNITEATNVIADNKILRGKGVDHNPVTGEIIHNLYNTNSIRSPTNMKNKKSMSDRTFLPRDKMKTYKARWFIHNEFSYGSTDGTTLEQPINQSLMNRRPKFSDTHQRNSVVMSGEFFKRNIRKQATDPEAGKLTYTKVCGPDWLKVTPAGMISGTPGNDDVDNDYKTMLVRVSDSGGLFDVATFEFRVDAAGAPTPMPTQNPTTPKPTLSPFLDRTANFDELVNFGHEGPFGKCGGDYDGDEDCMPGLVCYKRDGEENDVPGCGGKAEKNDHYCIYPMAKWDDLYEHLQPINQDKGGTISTLPSSVFTSEPTRQPSSGHPNGTPSKAPSSLATMPLPTTTGTSASTQCIPAGSSCVADGGENPCCSGTACVNIVNPPIGGRCIGM